MSLSELGTFCLDIVSEQYIPGGHEKVSVHGGEWFSVLKAIKT